VNEITILAHQFFWRTPFLGVLSETLIAYNKLSMDSKGRSLPYAHLIVIGASAGGIPALQDLITPLPVDFLAPIFIVMHIQERSPSGLPQVMRHYSKLPVTHPMHGDRIQAGHIYVAPPDVHMTVFGDQVHLHHGPKINHCIPAIDPLFCSAAVCGRSVIGILLSGLLNDGTEGLAAIKQHHGITMVQDLTEAQFKDMPENAMKRSVVDFCLPARTLASLLVEIVKT
jgi:two-component system, chemotaxis family, protein-glutamate methylesterase/glutaminase